jgi:hypothetical protein
MSHLPSSTDRALNRGRTDVISLTPVQFDKAKFLGLFVCAISNW